MDTHAFASLAQLRILLIPVGNIQKSTFEKYVAEIRSFEQIRLGDIPPDDRDERARFMPNPLSAGYIHLSFPSHPPPSSHAPLSLLRPSHFPLAVIGVASCSDSGSLATILNQHNTRVFELFPTNFLFPLARNCFVFETGDSSTNLNLGESLPGLVVIPNMMGNKKLYIGTLLADLCSHVLGEFGALAQTLETPFGNEYLNSSVMPVLPPRSEFPATLDIGSGLELNPFPAFNSQPEISKSTFSRTPAPLKRNSSVANTASTNYRQTQFGAQVGSKKRVSGIGAASSHGRLFKVLGDLYLLAGRTEDAVVWFSEAIQLFKVPQDTAWHASTLEALATISVIDAWAAGQGLNNSMSTSKEPWNEISEKLTQAASLYQRISSSDLDQNFALLSYLYSCCVLRHAYLLFAVWSAKGWGPLAFSTMLQPGPNPYLPPTLSHDNSWAIRERLSSISGISRSAISSALAPVHGPWLLHLGARERIAVLETTASIYACLGYRRKEAYILREVLGCILDLLVCGREEDGSSRLSTIGLGIESPDVGEASQSVAIRVNESSAGNQSILRLLKHVCKVLGINLDAVQLLENEYCTELSQDKEFGQCYDAEVAEEFQEPYGWPELQVGVVREAVAVAEALPDHLAVAQFALSALKTLHTILGPGDQFHLYSTSIRAITTARRRGDTRYLDFWSGRPIISIMLAPVPLPRLPIEKPLSILSARLSQINPVISGGTDPFLYNPRKALGQDKVLVVQNEELEFVVVLQNPYVFELELEAVSLSTSGVLFETRPIRVAAPATSFHQIILTGKALEIGQLVVRGCIVRAPGGASREFIIPLATEEEEVRLARRRSALMCEAGRSKYSGLDSLPWGRTSKRSSMQPSTKGNLRFLECVVVPEQPLLRIRRTSITHGALMLYDGEMSTLRITLENVSKLPVDFVRLAFEDSSMAPAQQALADGELSVFDTYETEYDLIHRPLFSWHDKESTHVAPGEQITLTVNTLGKVGCSSGAVHISYAYVRRHSVPSRALSEVFHTRQLSYPVMVTVYQMLECNDMDVLPFPFYGDNHLDQCRDILLHSNLISDDEGWCLFAIEVRNTYGTPFEVTFERLQDGTAPGKTTTIISPGSTSRVVIPIKKILLSREHVSKEIPTLSDRQFVVTKSKLSSDEEETQRELFWYREELFKCIQGRWREANGTRYGDISLRRQRMSLHMLETLRSEKARLRLSLVSYNDDDQEGHVLPHQMYIWYPQPYEFVYLRTIVTNLSLKSEVTAVDLELEPAEHIIYEGVQSPSIGRLQPGESREIEIPVCFLCYGRFEITVRARFLESQKWIDDRTSKGCLTALVREPR